MTRKEKLEILNEAFDLMVAHIGATDNPEAIDQYIQTAGNIAFFGERIMQTDPQFIPYDTEPEPVKTAVETPEPYSDPIPFPAEVVKEPDPEEEKKPKPTVNRADVRKLLSKKLQEGFDVQSLFAEFGVTRLSELPDEKLSELVEKVGE